MSFSIILNTFYMWNSPICLTDVKLTFLAHMSRSDNVSFCDRSLSAVGPSVVP